jgi:hypothetical protein
MPMALKLLEQYSISKFFNTFSGHLTQNTEIQDFFQVLKNKFGFEDFPDFKTGWAPCQSPTS